VPVAAGLQNLGVDPATIVLDKNSQLLGGILQVQVDITRPGVPEGIHQRFPADAVHLIANGGPQGHSRTFHNDAEINRLFAAQFLRNPRE